MWRHTVLTFTLVTGILAGPAGAQTPVLLGFDDMNTRFAVLRAVEGATRRLARPGCQEVFSDFADEKGQALSTKLTALGTSPAEALDLLRFVDNRRAPQCGGGARLAFTQTGSRLIHICGREFTDWSIKNPALTEIIVIHESLHAVGLGENPPTSEAITERVAMRCGG